MSTELQKIEHAVQSAVLQGAAHVHNRLVTASKRFSSEVKLTDGSRVTGLDRDSEQLMDKVLKAELADLDIARAGEEGTRGGHFDGSKRIVFYDPTDGTANVRLLAPGSTVGACLYDPQTSTFEAAAVADPWFGRLVYTVSGKTYQRSFNVKNIEELGAPQECRVSSKTFADGGEILIEVMHGFIRSDWLTGEKRSVLTTEGILNLIDTLQTWRSTKVRSLSSNLMHQLLVASGGDGIATIMTAVGGPWDMSGVGLVLGAGGCVWYVRGEAGNFVKTEDPLLADMVICTNNEATAMQIYDVLTGRLD